jgi:anti-anti-sigma regulatory factor
MDGQILVLALGAVAEVQAVLLVHLQLLVLLQQVLPGVLVVFRQTAVLAELEELLQLLRVLVHLALVEAEARGVLQSQHMPMAQTAALCLFWPLPGRLHGRLTALFMAPALVEAEQAQQLLTVHLRGVTAVNTAVAGVLVAVRQREALAAQAVKVLLLLPTRWLLAQVGMLLREIKALTLSQVKLPMFCLGGLLLL